MLDSIKDLIMYVGFNKGSDKLYAGFNKGSDHVCWIQ